MKQLNVGRSLREGSGYFSEDLFIPAGEIARAQFRESRDPDFLSAALAWVPGLARGLARDDKL
jgi:hypothetical protein